MSEQKITERPSPYRHLEKMPTSELLFHINDEDNTVPHLVRNVVPRIERLVDAIVSRMTAGGRLFYIGAGTSGRLGILDASECPPTYGVPATMITGIMAGGYNALHTGIEDAEDDEEQGWRDLADQGISANDFVVGIAASGTTPYVVGALREARTRGIATGCIVCNHDTPVAAYADHPLEVIVGPEFVSGSTRMKCGTAQKLILNMISTTVMIRTGRVRDNYMLYMQITNEKLVDRGVRMLMEKKGIADYEIAKSLLIRHGSVQSAMDGI